MPKDWTQGGDTESVFKRVGCVVKVYIAVAFATLAASLMSAAVQLTTKKKEEE